MRFIIIFLPAIILSCSSGDTVEAIERIAEYDIPIGSTSGEVVYTYMINPEFSTVTHRYKFTEDTEGAVVNQKIYYNNELTFERRYRKSNNMSELLKEYYHEYPGSTTNIHERLEGDIRSYKNIEDGKRFKGLKSKISYLNSMNFRTYMEEEDTFVGDTVVMWNGNEIPSLKFRYKIITTTYIKYLPFRSDRTETIGTTYYVKGIGLFMIKYSAEGENYTMSLLSIERK